MTTIQTRPVRQLTDLVDGVVALSPRTPPGARAVPFGDATRSCSSALIRAVYFASLGPPESYWLT
jgi:hypothetical protein